MCAGQPSFDYAWHCGGLCNDDDGTLTVTDNKNQSSSAGQFFDTLFHAFPFFPCRTQNETERRKCLLLSFILYFILSHSICVPSLFSWYKLFPHTFFSYVFCLFRRCSFLVMPFTHSVSPFFLFGCCFQFLFHSIWNLFVQIAFIGWVPWQLSPLAHLQQQIHINIHLEINFYAGKTHKTSNFACDDSLLYRHFNHSFMYHTHSRAHFTSPKNSDI